MAPRSAGVLVFRRREGGVDLLLGHMGGPFWAKREEGGWTIPKGLIDAGEAAEDAARREFREETGLEAPAALVPLTPLRASGKILAIWLAEGDLDLSGFASNAFEIQWPPRSGRTITAPELDRIAYLPAEEALGLVVEGQRRVLEEALERVARRS
jgi:predicted NUDIX family NTP pyrophosphohydrolase